MPPPPDDLPRHENDDGEKPDAGADAGAGAAAGRREHAPSHRAEQSAGTTAVTHRAGHEAAHRAPARDTRVMRLLLIVGIVLALGVVVALFFVGLRVGAGGTAIATSGASSAAIHPTDDAGETGSTGSDAAARATPTPTPATPTVSPPPSVPAAPGVHDWNELAGGECLTGYTSPWELQFTVVDCATEHAAQLVSRGAFAEDATAPYPGEPELVSRLNLLCTSPSVLDYAAAAQVPDVQWQAAYPADDAQWTSGDRSYFCFFSRPSGEPLGVSLAVPPTG
ncbi:septum formation family protein [Herbiconiux daphne]|uniref:Septum formation family protein n=1 Tax=Herbiconiux daphne TaxID=2970914 RepID=A0ABT2H7S7_9MICO|nr:septum formation family protein [Herbiconiux daphne]MCS5735923.1 septum formation family protein [Herbiconiux daphne]